MFLAERNVAVYTVQFNTQSCKSSMLPIRSYIYIYNSNHFYKDRTLVFYFPGWLVVLVGKIARFSIFSIEHVCSCQQKSNPPMQCNYKVLFRPNMPMSQKVPRFWMLFSLLQLVNVLFRLFRDDDRLLGRAFHTNTRNTPLTSIDILVQSFTSIYCRIE